MSKLRLLSDMLPWVRTPLIVSAPMLGAATPALAVSVSRAGGIGFIAGNTKSDSLDKSLSEVAALLKADKQSIKCTPNTLPIGVGFQNWNCDLRVASRAIEKYLPAIAWLFAPVHTDDFGRWSRELRTASKDRTQIWIQVGSVREAIEAVQVARPDVLILQGTDAGGHGLAQSASIVSLIPETLDALSAIGASNLPVLAAGGVVEGRGVAAALVLGATGVVMGTRFLAATEAGIPPGWQREILRVEDGGVSTTRSTLCDRLKETRGWPTRYDGRMIINQGHADEKAGMSDEDHVEAYKQELKRGDDAWHPLGRMVAYTGTASGLVREVKPAGEIVDEVVADCKKALGRADARL